MGVGQKGLRSQLKEIPKAKAGTLWGKKKKDYNPEYKINIHESTLIQINDWINKYIGEKKQISCKKEFQVIYVDALKEGEHNSSLLTYELWIVTSF